MYGAAAAAGYFVFGFEPFVLAYAGSVTILVGVAWATLVRGEIPATRCTHTRSCLMVCDKIGNAISWDRNGLGAGQVCSAVGG